MGKDDQQFYCVSCDFGCKYLSTFEDHQARKSCMKKRGIIGDVKKVPEADNGFLICPCGGFKTKNRAEYVDHNNDHVAKMVARKLKNRGVAEPDFSKMSIDQQIFLFVETLNDSDGE